MAIPQNLFINREISWLLFNERVLQEANDSKNPLLERLKFLGIFSNNQDEFFRVRVGTLNRLAKLNSPTPAEYQGISPKNTLSQISQIVNQQREKFNNIYNNIVIELEKENIHIINETQLTEEQGIFAKEYFHKNIRPHLFPILLKNITNFSLLKDYAIYLSVWMKNSKSTKKQEIALIEISSTIISRFIELPSTTNQHYIIMVDDIIRYCLQEIFTIFDYDTFEAYTIKFTRDAELDIDNDISKSFMKILSESISKRKSGSPVRFIYDKTIPKSMLHEIMRKLKIKKEDLISEGSRYHNFKDFINFPHLKKHHLLFPPVKPIAHQFIESNKSIIKAIKAKDILLHFPYQSFQYIIDFLREASIDPKVESIHMSIYRLAKDSNVINALINAARNGKKVTVLMEMQARFDEEANICWANKLQEAGIKVIQGVPKLKVHGKLILIKRKEGKKIVNYANISTGNYNEITSEIYSDVSLLTKDPRITLEVNKIFDLFENNFKLHEFNHLWLSPNFMRKRLHEYIQKEIEQAKIGNKAHIILKVNNLVDTEIAQHLVKAAQNGVKVQLIVRGICTLIPGIEGKTENIEAISIIDKYLEHSRIFLFYNSGRNDLFISSADIMSRNLDRRIEVACPIYDKEIKQHIIDLIHIQLSDNQKARLIQKEKFNNYVSYSIDQKKIRSQKEIYNYIHKLNS